MKLYECMIYYIVLILQFPLRPKYIDNGINSFSVSIQTRYSLLPLDAIFKCIHASKDCQYIKYNPIQSRYILSFLHRKNGKKWKKNTFFENIREILKYSRELGRREQIADYGQ